MLMGLPAEPYEHWPTLRVSRMPAHMRHRKLVRDRVPDLIRSRGEIAETTVLSAADYTTALLDKLVEEAVELRIAEPGQHIEELADVWEVLTTATEQLGLRCDLGDCLRELRDARVVEREPIDHRRGQARGLAGGDVERVRCEDLGALRDDRIGDRVKRGGACRCIRLGDDASGSACSFGYLPDDLRPVVGR